MIKGSRRTLPSNVAEWQRGFSHVSIKDAYRLLTEKRNLKFNVSEAWTPQLNCAFNYSQNRPLVVCREGEKSELWDGWRIPESHLIIFGAFNLDHSTPSHLAHPPYRHLCLYMLPSTAAIPGKCCTATSHTSLPSVRSSKDCRVEVRKMCLERMSGCRALGLNESLDERESSFTVSRVTGGVQFQGSAHSRLGTMAEMVIRKKHKKKLSVKVFHFTSSLLAFLIRI